MDKFDFEITVRVNEKYPNEHYVEILHEQNRCNDSLIGMGHEGRLGFMFTREGRNLRQAYMSSVHDIHKAIPDATIINAKFDSEEISI